MSCLGIRVVGPGFPGQFAAASLKYRYLDAPGMSVVPLSDPDPADTPTKADTPVTETVYRHVKLSEAVALALPKPGVVVTM